MQTSGNSLDTLIDNTGEGTFYAWYSSYFTESGAQTVDGNTLESGTYVYYARWQFTLTLTISGSNTSMVIEQSATNGSQSDMTYTITAYEGNYVEVKYTTGTHSVGSLIKYTINHTLVTITIYDYEDGEVIDSCALYAKKTNSGNGDRRFTYSESTYDGDWIHTDIVTDSDRITGGTDSITINGNAGITWSV